MICGEIGWDWMGCGVFDKILEYVVTDYHSH